ncbi:hypothetical protein [Microbacterium sp. JZ31]|nr:hypothetical protein [Microbacterium sp. JZ31]
MRSSPFQRVDSCTSIARPSAAVSRMTVVTSVYSSVKPIAGPN